MVGSIYIYLKRRVSSIDVYLEQAQYMVERNEYENRTEMGSLKEQDISIIAEAVILQTSNELIIALEDIIEYLGNAHGTWGNSRGSFKPSRSKYFEADSIKLKVIHIKILYVKILQTLKDYIVCDNDTKEGIEHFQRLGYHYIDEILSHWMIRNDTKKAIEDAHDMCYKLRKLNRKLELL